MYCTGVAAFIEHRTASQLWLKFKENKLKSTFGLCAKSRGDLKIDGSWNLQPSNIMFLDENIQLGAKT